ncbi:MAG TPA: cation transporter, partial [Syntrophales bacterium]|nr:cation transporter [Syntrophales bacterium]
MERTTFKVRGMDCAEETNALRRTVGSLSGVTDVTFNLLQGTMTVTAAEGAAGERDILSAVERAGMSARPAGDGDRSPSPASAGTFWRSHGRAILCAASGVSAAAGFLSHWILKGSLADALMGGGWNEAHPLPAVSIAFYLAAVAAGGWFVLPKAASALRRVSADMNLLMTIAVLGAAVIGEWFEAAAVTFLFSLSLVLEAWSVGRARDAVTALIASAPQTARYICPHDGDIMERPVEDVPLGATVLVRPGERIPLDGIITEGGAFVNQAPVTGESLPVEKRGGDPVFAGSIDEDGAIAFRVTKPASDTVIARIVRMVEEAQSRRAPSEQWV